MIRLLALVTHETLRESLRQLFAVHGDVHMAGIADSAEDCLEQLAAAGKHRFHGLLLDAAHAKELRVLLKRLGDVLPDLPILALCPRNTPPFVREALSASNTTLLEKDGDPDALIAAIRSALADPAARRAPTTGKGPAPQ